MNFKNLININMDSFQSFFSYLQTKLNKLHKTSVWTRILVLLIIFLIIFQLGRDYTPRREGFVQREKFILKKTPTEIYDSFYSDIYDELHLNSVKNNFEIGELKKHTNMEPKRAVILDIGPGNGHHMNRLHKMGANVVGLDISKSMIRQAGKRYPGLHIDHGNATDSMLYTPDQFTHILCLYFTIYYIQDKKAFFESCFKWLKPGGYLAVHLVNRELFNPIVNSADPLVFVSPQKYAKKRITNSTVKFRDFQYKADFKLLKDKNTAEFNEIFKDDQTGNVRKHQHTFYMPTQKYILSLAKECGFILHSKIDLVGCQYEYQYIYVLYKPE